MMLKLPSVRNYLEATDTEYKKTVILIFLVGMWSVTIIDYFHDLKSMIT